MKKKTILSIMLCVSIFFSTDPNMKIVLAAKEPEKTVQIQHNNEEVNRVTFDSNEKAKITAESIGFDGDTYQWQILLDSVNSIWVDIQGEDKEEIEVSYAMIKNLLQGTDTVYMRCIGTSGEEEIISNGIAVSVTFQTEQYIEENIEYELVSDIKVEEIKIEPNKDEKLEVLEEVRDKSLEIKEETSVNDLNKDINKEDATKTDIDNNDITQENINSVEDIEEGSETQATMDEDQINSIENENNGIALMSTRNLPEPIADENVEYVTIMIKYLDVSSLSGLESSIYSPYTATIEKGGNFKQNVVSPTFLGFAPYLDKDGDKVVETDATVIALDYTKLENDVTINVYYKPIKVTFAIRYFFQNINDDLYTEDVSLYHTGMAETGTIVSDEYLKEQAGDTIGFEKLYHYPENVAADGSTEFECYYDRNYYLMTFELDGGYGTDPIYARYDAPFIANTPIKVGYEFEGWDLLVDTDGDGIGDTGDGKVETNFPSTIQAENRAYKAIWKTNETAKVTVVFWGQDANNDNEYTYYSSGIVEAETEKEFSFVDESMKLLACGKDEHTHTSACSEYQFCTQEEHVHTEECCLKDEHTHNIGCFDNVGSANTSSSNVSGAPANPVDGQIYKRSGFLTSYKRVIYIAGTWYLYNGSENSGAIISPNSSCVGAHKHGDGNCSCAKEEHTHTSECKAYTCGKTNHAHSESCYQIGSQMDSSKWRLVDRGSTIVMPDGSSIINVYYDRIPFRMTFKATGSNGAVLGEIYKKWGADIKAEFNAISEANTYLWSAESNGDSPWISFIDVMPAEDRTYYAKTTNSTNTQTATYYGMKADGSGEYEVLYTVNINYSSNVTVSEEEFVEIEGYTFNSAKSSKIGDNYSGAKFYYDRQTGIELAFSDGFNKVKSVSTYYGQSLAEFESYEPQVPIQYDKNSVEFAGWYLNPECTGKEYVLSEHTMPSTNQILYAKWVSNVHTIRFFMSYNDMVNYENGQTVTPYLVLKDFEHGNVVGSIETPTKPNEGNLELAFAGWFYMRDGQKRAFSPLDIPINNDMNIFADWSSNQPQPFKIDYVLQSNPSVKVAEDTTGFAYGGSTRTFVAKAGEPFNQLYPEYNVGYFPTVGSHSITMQYEEDKERPQNNIYTFYYVKATDIEYTIRYVNKETNTVMKEKKAYTNKSVTTERFEAFENLVPDSFYKRLVLEVEYNPETGEYEGTENNVVTFYYTPNKTSAYYAVHFMLEKLNATDAEKNNFAIDGSGGYEESGTHVEGIGDIGSDVSIIPQDFSGFELLENKALNVINGKETSTAISNGEYSIEITSSGTELYVFYARKKYGYKVHYYHYNTTTSVSQQDFPSENGVATYGSTLQKTAKDIPGYTCVSELTQEIPIRDKEEQNQIIFYYSPTQYVAEYVAVPQNGGWLSSTIEVITGSEELSGSTPNVNKYSEFVGWFIDEECTQSAEPYGTIDATTNKFTPDKNKLSETNRNVFYAKFKASVGDLTIRRTNVTDNKQTFAYRLTNKTTKDVINFTITGNDSVTIAGLPFEQYTIEQLNGWSWRYSDAIINVNYDTSGTILEFNGAISNEQWLHGNSQKIRRIRG